MRSCRPVITTEYNLPRLVYLPPLVLVEVSGEIVGEPPAVSARAVSWGREQKASSRHSVCPRVSSECTGRRSRDSKLRGFLQHPCRSSGVDLAAVCRDDSGLQKLRIIVQGSHGFGEAPVRGAASPPFFSVVGRECACPTSMRVMKRVHVRTSMQICRGKAE
eukprot:3791633-Rhodomonas_salina.1